MTSTHWRSEIFSREILFALMTHAHNYFARKFSRFAKKYRPWNQALGRNIFQLSGIDQFLSQSFSTYSKQLLLTSVSLKKILYKIGFYSHFIISQEFTSKYVFTRFTKTYFTNIYPHRLIRELNSAPLVYAPGLRNLYSLYSIPLS